MTTIEIKNPTGAYRHEWRPVAGMDWQVCCYSLVGGGYLRYTVWCPTNSTEYSSITYNGGRQQYGELTSLRIGSDIDALPRGPERVRMVRAHYATLEALAEEVIRSTFPEDFAPQE